LCALWLAAFIFLHHTNSDAMFILAFCVVSVLAYQLYWVLPYTQFNAVEVDTYTASFTTDSLNKSDSDSENAPNAEPTAGLKNDPATLCLMSCNVLMTNRQIAPLLTQIKDHQPDIFIMLESDLWWQEQIEDATDFPYKLCYPQDNYYGMHVYSRLAMHETSIDFLVDPDKPSMRFQVCPEGGTLIQIHVMHPAPPSPTENTDFTESDVELISLAKTLSDTQTPTIVAADLNDVAWSATTRLFRQLSGLLDPRIGRGVINTFNAFHWAIRWPLDHVFISKHFTLIQLKRLPHMGSDHFPLLVTLALEGNSGAQHDLTDTPVDTQLANNIMQSDVVQQARLGL